MSDQRLVIERINQASAPEVVLEVFEKALVDVGADYFAINFLPRPEQRIEDVSIAWHVPAEWRALYSGENFFQRDPAFVIVVVPSCPSTGHLVRTIPRQNPTCKKSKIGLGISIRIRDFRFQSPVLAA